MKRTLFATGLILFSCIGCGINSTVPTPLQIQAAPTITPQPTEIAANYLSESEIATLSSLTLIDPYPLYTMHFVGDYEESASMLNDHNHPDSWACTLFASLSDQSEMLYGRNFDWDYSPALLLFTDPPGGYASVSVVDIAYFEFSSDDLPRLDQLPLAERAALLEAPWWPFDGMNEEGLVIGMAAVPDGNMAIDPDKETLDSLEVMRRILDQARNVDEALEIISNHNIDMEGGPSLHYLIADRSGRAILVEFLDGELVVIPNESPWHVATNFLCSSVGGAMQGHCRRYDTVSETLSSAGGLLQVDEGIALLDDVSQANTQWSVIYGITTGSVDIVIGQDFENVLGFQLGAMED